MASRPIFFPTGEASPLVEERAIEFKWHPGMAVSQKQKSIASLHDSAKVYSIGRILEVSSKSPELLGQKLSAFFLELCSSEFGEITVESAFQGSKVFANGGPYRDLYCKTGREIKKDSRLKESGSLRSFNFEREDWPLIPRTAFYDWLYLNALKNNPELAKDLLRYDAFTDIEFNPKKSINCQARSCALYLALHRLGKIDSALNDRDLFMELLKDESPKEPTNVSQKTFFD